MKKDVKKLRETKPEELQKKLNTLRENLRELRFKSEGSKSKNVKEARALRKDIARVLTVMSSSGK